MTVDNWLTPHTRCFSWSKPPANGMTLASHDPRYFGASIGPIEEEDEEASTIGIRETSAAAVAGSAAEATPDRITSTPSPRFAHFPQRMHRVGLPCRTNVPS